MIKILKFLLPSILFLSFTVSTTENVKTIKTYQYASTSEKPFYKKINQGFEDGINWNKVGVFVNTGEINASKTLLTWSNYADSWDEFKANYNTLNLEFTLELYYWDDLRWSSSSINLSVSDIGTGNWLLIERNYNKTRNTWRKDMTYGDISFQPYVDGNRIVINYRAYSYATNYNDWYYFTVISRQITASPNTDYVELIKSKFNTYVDNHTLNLESDYNTSLVDPNNIPIEEKALDELIQSSLGEYYSLWKSFIKDYAYSDKTNQATVTVKFTHPDTNQPTHWEFFVPINFTLSQEYWNKQFKDRIKIQPGKIINPNNPNGEMIEDTPLHWQDKDVYSTTASVRFDGASDSSETMKVNGIPIHVIDNTFTFEMTDNQTEDDEGKLVNEYDILLEKHDLEDFNKVIGHYEVKYAIKQDIPNLDLSWYAWNPEKNPDQKKLITPTLPNGDPNPNYDKEVDVKTGTKKQIMWVKNKAQNPFPLDPLNKEGDKITDNSEYIEGFIAEGSVSGMGIIQGFDDPWIKSVERAEVDAKTLKLKGDFEKVNFGNDDRYFSNTGTYLYVLTDQKDLTSSKFITIGQQWQNKYAKFLDVLNQPDVAVPFWSTLQGFHLKNYLAKYKELNSKQMQDLSFEQVSSYWKEYVSDVKSQHIGPGVDPGEDFDFQDMKFETIKMNKDNVNEIREEIKKQVQEQLEDSKLVYGEDYELKPFDDDRLNQLLNYDSNGNAMMTLTISALATSVAVIGSNTIEVMNNLNYDPDKVVDLKNIKFDTKRYNFSEFTVDQLREWIFKDINSTFNRYQVSLDYPEDYGVSPLDEDVLTEFLTSKNVFSLVITIYSQDESIKAKNSTTLELINDPDAPIAPPDPDPNPDPEPKDPKNWITKPVNLIIMSVVAVLIVGGIGTVMFLKFRLKKGIGGKKSRVDNLSIKK